ncbi:hypothetical protein Tco_0325841 [Tanacetum coccineum]
MHTAGIGLFTTSDSTLNKVTRVSAVKEVETPFVVNMTVEKEKLNSVEDTTVLGSFLSLSTPVTTSVGNAPSKSLYDNITAYGFFLGKRVAYLVVANYVRNTWGKYGLVRSIFSSMDGLDAMLKNGPWFIQNHPLILKK